MTLKFYTSVAKGLKLKPRKFLGLRTKIAFKMNQKAFLINLKGFQLPEPVPGLGVDLLCLIRLIFHIHTHVHCYSRLNGH